MRKIIHIILQKKLLTGIIVIVLGTGGYVGYTKLFTTNDDVRYVLAEAKKGTLIISISGSGQVSSSSSLDIKPKVSGDLLRVSVKEGQSVKAGAIIAEIDANDARKTVRDAEVNLESAELALQKLEKPADHLTILQSENTLIQAKDTLTKLKLSQEIDAAKDREAKTKAEDNLKKAYEDGFTSVANAFLDFPDVMTGLRDVLLGNSVSVSQQNIEYYANAVQNFDNLKATQYQNDAQKRYDASRALYDANFTNYKGASRFSSTITIETLIEETYDTAKSIAEAVKSANNLIQFYQDKLTENNRKPIALSNTHLASLDTFTGKTNAHLASLLQIKRTIQDSKEAIVNADRAITTRTQNDPLALASAEQSVKEREIGIEKLKAGPDALDIASQQLSLKQRRNTLRDAQEKLADYVIRAPFDGIIAKSSVKRGDAVSSGTLIATLIAEQKIAEISLNEVDVAKVKTNQKATLIFDAIPDLTITSEVVSIDALGTVAQGVVTYTVKLAFDTEDSRVKPGMSVSATIITEARPNVLLVPNAAVKQQNDISYVEVVRENISIEEINSNGVTLKQSPERQTIETGLSNDEMTEIVNGLQEGDRIVARTIQPTGTQTQQTQSLFQIPGQGGRGGNIGGGQRGGGR